MPAVCKKCSGAQLETSPIKRLLQGPHKREKEKAKECEGYLRDTIGLIELN